jgi:hypothetical protein
MLYVYIKLSQDLIDAAHWFFKTSGRIKGEMWITAFLPVNCLQVTVTEVQRTREDVRNKECGIREFLP